MSEYDEHSSERSERRRETDAPDETPQAVVRAASWSPWVWIIPVLAIFFAGYLVVRYGFFGGGDITVHFADARGLDRYSPVRFRGAKVGTVQKITIDEKLGEVIVRISMDASMNGALRKGTRFWIMEPALEGGGIGGLLSGTSVGIAPGPGPETREFQGQEYAPILPTSEEGKTFILEAHGLGSLAAGSPVQFNGMRVGRVLGAEYDDKRGISSIHIFVVQRFANNVRESTRFWRGGGVSVSLAGGGVTMSGASLSSLLSAPVAFSTPEVMAGAPAADGTHFELYESQALAEAASNGPQLDYMVYFSGPVKGLTAGTAVQMRGVQIGRVRDVRLRYVAESASLETPVTIEIDPRKLELDVNDLTSRDELRQRMNDALAKLVEKGLRASLATSLVLPGASGVNLDLVAPRGSARLVLAHDPPIIPAASGGSGLEGALASMNDLGARIRNLPLEEITGNLRSMSLRLNSLVHDPVLDESLKRLDASLKNIEEASKVARQNAGPIATSVRNAATAAEGAAKTIEGTATTVKQNVEPIAASLRNAATSAEAAAHRAEQLMGSSVRQDYDLGALVKELTRAAESVRALASYLTENPDSLLKGRSK